MDAVRATGATLALLVILTRNWEVRQIRYEQRRTEKERAHDAMILGQLIS